MQTFTLPLRGRLLNLFVLCGLLLLNACNSGDDPAPPSEENQHLIQSTVITEIPKEQLVNEAGNISPLLKSYVKNGVKVYKITYKTKNTDGTDITASGALILPDTDQPVSMISVQHGTIREDASAPSNFNEGSEAASFGSLFGSMGYIIAYPDYIGYGESNDLPHTYEHREGLSTACLDMLRAAKEYLKDQTAVKWDEKLYIAGYSEGGYATMALQKKIEEEASSEFNLRASSCGAGAYDKTAFMKYIVNDTTDGIASSNSLYLWVLLTYDRIYDLNKPASYYFKEPFATRISDAGIDVTINQSFNTILTDTFRKGLNDESNKEFLDAVADNNVYDWKPKTPTRLYHGNADRTVFYFNSEHALNAMKARGAADVQLVTVPNGTHASSITPFLIGTLTFFTSTK